MADAVLDERTIRKIMSVPIIKVRRVFAAQELA
jgi:hypothetical protein